MAGEDRIFAVNDRNPILLLTGIEKLTNDTHVTLKYSHLDALVAFYYHFHISERQSTGEKNKHGYQFYRTWKATDSLKLEI